MGDLHAKWRLDPFVAKRFVLFLERRVSCKRVAKKDVTTQFEAIIQTGRFWTCLPLRVMTQRNRSASRSQQEISMLHIIDLSQIVSLKHWLEACAFIPESRVGFVVSALERRVTGFIGRISTEDGTA